MTERPRQITSASSPRHSLRFDSTLRASLVAVAGMAVVITATVAVARGGADALSAVTGGAIASVNLWMFAHIVRGVLVGGARGRLWALGGMAKLLVLLGGVWLLLRSGLASGGMLALGYAALPVGVVAAALLGSRLDAPPPEPPGARKKDLVTAAPTHRGRSA